MPRPRKPLAEWIAVAVVWSALPAAVRSAALAASAGTLFEAAPFVLAAALVSRGPLARLFGFLGCGCGRLRPGALALPAFGICWLAFGPAVALVRAAGAGALRFAGADALGFGPGNSRFRRRGMGIGPDSVEKPDPLHELARLAPQAIVGALMAELLRATLPEIAGPAFAVAFAEFACGALLGTVLPCATGSVAIAASLRSVAPAASAGILCTAGVVTFRSGRIGSELRSARFGFFVLAVACGLIAWRGPSGFVNARFVIPLGGAALVAAALAIRSKVETAATFPAAVPALLIAATIAGSPLPDRPPAQTTLDGPYAGETLRFTGALVRRSQPMSGSAILVRYTITCCRADAEARAIRLDRPLPGAAGSWYVADGTLVLGSDGAYVLRVVSVRPIPAPSDPFAYR